MQNRNLEEEEAKNASEIPEQSELVTDVDGVTISEVKVESPAVVD